MKNVFRLQGEDWVTSPYKRNFDIALTLGVSPVAIPVGLTALALTRILDGDDTIFRQTRYGDGRTEGFMVRKITSMRETSESNGIRVPTPFGAIMRPVAVDEIPQLINVLEGTMSLVGPRAQTAHVRANMQAALDRNTYDEWLNAVELSRPGGFSSFGINIRQPETERGFITKARMDIVDFNNASLKHDVAIIRRAARTAIGVLTPDLRRPAEASTALSEIALQPGVE
ncbi:MAG TPA: sugar transferase [Candidatus Saccharimonadales bacterium]|nr:sugar transferase [Candidatus Saccharimonadales bacterium]